jgi:plasmid stability protein
MQGFYSRICLKYGKVVNWNQNGTVMANITVKNIPEKTYQILKERAKRNNRSLNSEIILSLQLHALRSENNNSKILEIARKSQTMGKGFLTDSELIVAKQIGRE